MSISKSWDF